MSTVILLHPMGADIPLNILRGEHTGPANKVIIPSFPHDQSSAVNANAGADALDAALHANSPPFEIIGWSMGGAIAALWDRRDPDIDPADITRIITLGNNERKYNGVSVLRPTEFPAIFGGLGFRDATPYTVIEFVRQYDFWADHPNTYTNSTAALNALLGMGVHGDYTKVGLGDVGNTSYTEPGSTRTYMLSPTFPCPIVNLHWLAWIPWIRNSEDAAKRAIIEPCFSRPSGLSTIPDPSPARTSSTVTNLTTAQPAPVSSSVGDFPVVTTKSTQQINRPTVNPFRIGMWPWQSP